MNTKLYLINIKLSSLAITLLSSLFSASLSYAASIDYSAIPPTLVNADARPIVMLTMTNDHQLSYKAYTDFDDIIKADGSIGTDGTIETTYTDVFNYYGYFDSKKCYSYTSSRFEPVGLAIGTNNHHCSGARWSGNFLNWVAMSRMDIVRKVLYGGKRQVDSAGETVLERSYIPNDNHAWAKFFPATDIDKYTPYSSADDATGLTFCNVTPHDGTHEYSEDTTSTPRLRVAKGKWDNWAAQERIQCFWDGEAPLNRTNADTPNSGTEGLADLVVRVKVCDSALIGFETCRSYGASNKPTGLLQKYAEIGAIDFGLLTGSYEKGKSGGVLRKNISPIVDIENLDTSIDEIDMTTGQFTSVNGIIGTLNKLRISRYSYNDNGYGAGSVDDCPFGQNTWSDGECSNWGNPMGEIYLEALRYLSRAGAAHTDYAAPDDDDWIDGLAKNVTWRDPFAAAATSPVGGGYPACAKPNIINISSGTLSFDHDQYSGQSDVGGSLNVATETNAVGALELNGANTYYVGDTNSVGSAGDTCSAASVANLSTVTGLCPEAAGLQGSFNIAGLAAYAHKTDLRSGVDGEQKVNTYSIALAPPIPDIKVDVGGSTVRIIPVGRNWRNNNAMVLVNFQIISQTATSGEFFMNYENAPAGADHDSDFKGYLSYQVSGNNISIVAYNTGSSAGSTMHMGYIIDGVTDPGVHYLASNKNVTLTNSTGGGTYTVTKATIEADCIAQATSNPLVLPASGSLARCTTNIAGGTNRDLRGARTHTKGTSTSVLLKSPLWYAAKWGNFQDLDGSNTPNSVNEWDSKNNSTGSVGSDGEPDNYFLVTNPAVLEKQLESALNDILQRVSAGSAAAVIADSTSTVGSVYQALYQPSLIKDGKKVTWVGLIHSIFIDEYGNLREDTNSNAQLDTSDNYIQLRYAGDFKRTMVYYCTPGKPPLTCPLADRKEINDLKPIWNARDELATFSAKDTRLTSQRDYTTSFADSSGGGRHILTWQDLDGDNEIDSSEIVDFVASNFNDVDGSGNPEKAGLLGVADSGVPADNAAEVTEVENIVNFIRGYEDPATTGYRSRTIDFLPATGDEVWRLGDIVHSSPIVVGPPEGTNYGANVVSWDSFGDPSYIEYKTRWEERRNVIYLGANDGLIHAFNAGFYDDTTRQYCLDAACVNNTATSHPLGAELWAYAPRNLLPQLKFLTELGYPHVYYMDGEPRTFDVNIFPDDTDHPKGWGTILVVGMRFGGGAHNPISVDVDNTGSTTFTTGSAYVIFDVTNPEAAPKVLGEFTHADLGFTTSIPSLLVKRSADNANNWDNAGTGAYPNDFRLIFGSGPNDLLTGTSTQNAKAFMLKLELDNGVLDLNSSNIKVYDTAVANSFVGNPTAISWDGDFLFDNVYFGIAGGTEATPTGSLMRIDLNGNDDTNWLSSTMLDTSQPFLNMPVPKVLENPQPVSGEDPKEPWVFVGTGRLYTGADNLSSSQQSFYGLKETRVSKVIGTPITPIVNKLFSTSSADTNHVQNVNDIEIFIDGTVTIPAALSSEITATNFDDLVAHMDSKHGWYVDFTIPSSSERDLARATYTPGIIAFPTYVPSANQCQSEGNSFINYLFERTGTAYPQDELVDTTNYSGDTSNYESETKIDYGFGLVSEIDFKKNKDGTITVICTTSTGEICSDIPPPPCTYDCDVDPADTGRQSWREILLF